jgi:hypothetical protein
MDSLTTIRSHRFSHSCIEKEKRADFLALEPRPVLPIVLFIYFAMSIRQPST